MKEIFPPLTAIMPSPVVLLSVRGDKIPNIITISWTGNICSEPPTVVVGIRPTRYSHGLIKKSGDFVLNIPTSKLIDKVIFCGTKSGKEYDKFAKCNFTPGQASKVKSPLIIECPINIECEITKIVRLGTHDLFIAKVLAVQVNREILDVKNKIDIEKVSLITYIPTVGQYWTIKKVLK